MSLGPTPSDAARVGRNHEYLRADCAGSRGGCLLPVSVEVSVMFTISMYPSWRRCPAKNSCGNIKMKTWFSDNYFFYACPRCQSGELVPR